MIPFASFSSLGLALALALPAIVLGLAGRPARAWLLSRAWILVATLIMLVILYGGPPSIGDAVAGWPAGTGRELLVVAGYALLQWAIASVFLRLRPRTSRRWPFYAALGLALLPLVATKLATWAGPVSGLGFLGLSYVTFRSLDVIFGIQDRLIKNLPAGELLAYLFFFPTISAGPIDRYRRFADDWNASRTRATFIRDLDGAVHWIFTGLLYKFILAALVRQYWMDPVAQQAGLGPTVAYMYAYSFYLFFDFAGYSAFAIGFSHLFGIRTPENFKRPFLARNIRDFWDRWHISLSWWFRDHVYMRFVMAATKGRWFKNKHVASYLGFLLSFGLMGLWHGLAIYYVLYGLYHAALLVAHDLFRRWNKQAGLWRDGPLWQAAGIVATFHAVCFGFLLFSGFLFTPGVVAGTNPPVAPPRPVFWAEATVEPASVAPGGVVTITAAVRAQGTGQALVDVEVRDQHDQKVFQRFFEDEAFAGGQPEVYAIRWPVPADTPPGRYQVVVAVFAPSWQSEYLWNEPAAVIDIGSDPAPAPAP